MRSNKDKFEVLHLGQNNAKQPNRLVSGCLGQLEAKALEVLEGGKTASSVHLQPWKQNMSWAALARRIVSGSRDVLISTSSTLIRIHQEYGVQFCPPPPPQVQEICWKTGEDPMKSYWDDYGVGELDIRRKVKGNFSLEKRKLRGYNHCLPVPER